MPAFTITDTADGTGATATVSGSAVGSFNTVFVQNVDGELGTGAWAAAGSRSGDGTVPLTLAKGYWWAYCLSNGTPTGLTYFRVTDGRDSVLSRCAAAVKARLQLLDLPCTKLVLDLLNDESPGLEQYPCVVLTTDGASQSNESALNGRDDIGQPVRCLVKDVCLTFENRNVEVYRGWRQSVFRAFHNQRLPGVPESVVNRVELGGGVTPVRTDRPQMIFELTVRCVTREVRGLGA